MLCRFRLRAAGIHQEEPEIIKFIAYLEAGHEDQHGDDGRGVRVIFDSDDFAFKTGPMMNPKLADELFGPSYRRITKAVHDRGGRILLHSCGDNTKMFDSFIEWGFDGGHAYEKPPIGHRHEKRPGDRFVVGGVGWITPDAALASESPPNAG
jgi:hypothetical protein